MSPVSQLFDIHGQPISSTGATPPGRGPDYRELGLPGTEILSGIEFEEQNPALQGSRSLDTFKAMGYDPTVAMTLQSLEQPLRASEWFFEPASSDQADIDLADFCHYNFFDFGSQSMDDLLRESITGRNQFGFAVFEKVWRRDDDRYPGKACLDKLAWRSQRTRYKWNIEEIDLPDGGRIRQLVSMTQWAPPFYQYVVLPTDKLAIFVRDKTGENFDGVPLLRKMFKPWYIRDRLYSIQAVGLERAYMGVPIARVTPPVSDAEMTYIRGVIKNLRTHENAYAILPSDVELELWESKLEGPAMQAAIEHHTKQIPMVALAQFNLLGTANTGSYALSTDQSDMFLMALNSDANYECEIINMQVVPQLIDFNFPNVPRSRYPRLVHGEIGQTDFLKYARALGILIQWGGLIPDDGMEDRMRKMLRLPERDGTITPDYLQDLVESMSPPDAVGRTHNAPRPLAPPGASVAEGALVTEELTKGGPANANMAEARNRLIEAKAQMPWRRPTERKGGVLTGHDRVQAKLAEQLCEMAEDMLKPRSSKPMSPSERAGRARKPYHLRMAESRPTEHGSGSDASKRDSEVAKVAWQHEAALRRFFKTRGEAGPRDEHVPLPAKNSSPVPFSEPNDDAS